MVESDIIGHLIEVEHQASSMVLDAQVEADQRIAEARAKSDSRYKDLYDTLVSSLEKQTGEQIEAVKKGYEKKFEEFSVYITKTPKDIPAFEEMLESVLFNA